MKFLLTVPQVLLARWHAVIVCVVAKAPTLWITAIFIIPRARHWSLRASELTADTNDGAAQYLAGDQLGAYRWYFFQRHGAFGYLR